MYCSYCPDDSGADQCAATAEAHECQSTLQAAACSDRFMTFCGQAAQNARDEALAIARVFCL
jgi:hypothetical protein